MNNFILESHDINDIYLQCTNKIISIKSISILHEYPIDYTNYYIIDAKFFDPQPNIQNIITDDSYIVITCNELNINNNQFLEKYTNLRNVILTDSNITMRVFAMDRIPR